MDTTPFEATYDIPAYNFPRLQWEVSKLNKVCQKLSLAPIQLSIEGTLTKGCSADETQGGYTAYIVRVVGTVPKLADWTLVARLEHLDGADTLVCTVPGQTVPEKYRHASCHCDHCQTQRNRKDTFVLLHPEKGYCQVGRQCIADFLGHADPQAIAANASFMSNLSDLMADASAEDEGYGTGGGSRRLEVNTEFFAANCVALTRLFGFVSKKMALESQGNKEATAPRVWTMLNDFSKGGSAEHDRNAVIVTDADIKAAREALAWAIGLKTTKPILSDYEHNIAALAAVETMQDKHKGFVASIHPAYVRHLEGEAARAERLAARADKPASNYIGEVGKRQVFTLTLKKVIGIEGYGGGAFNLMLLEDDMGNSVKWKTEYLPSVEVEGDDLPHEAEIGDVITVKATVKSHLEYTPKFEGATPIKQTTILRGKVEKIDFKVDQVDTTP